MHYLKRLGTLFGQVMQARTIWLSPLEAFRIFGFQPKNTIDWTVVDSSSTLSLRKLLDFGISQARLQQIQPSLAVWYASGRADLRDIGECEGKKEFS